MKTLVCAALIALAAGITPALADQITMSASNGNISFCSVSGGAIYVSAASFDGATCTPSWPDGSVSGNAMWDRTSGSPVVGSYSITLSTLVLTPAGGAVWNSAGGTGSIFNFTSGSGAITGLITWSTVTDATNPIQFYGSVQITGGSGALLASFPVGSTFGFDFTMNGGSGILSGLSASPGTYANTISSGQVAPVPEPASMVLLGSGLIAMGGFVRARRKRASR